MGTGWRLGGNTTLPAGSNLTAADTEYMSSIITGRVVIPDDFIAETPTQETIDAGLDAAWAALSAATDQVVRATSAALFAAVRAHVPAVRDVWVRMDTSHEPAHGHVDGIFTYDNHDMLPEVREEEWMLAVEEFAWDLGHVAPAHFVRHNIIGDTRRLIITTVDDSAS